MSASPGFFPATSMPDSDWWHALWPSPDRVLDDLGIGRCGLAVDLCCGDGWFTAPLARRAQRVVALDIDPAMIARAKQHLGSAPNCAFVAGDAYDVAACVPTPAEVVLNANTFHGVPDKPRLARAVAAAIAAGGRFIVINWHRLPRERTTVLDEPRGPPTEVRMSPEDVAATVAPAGFTLAQTVALPPYHYGCIFIRR